MKGKRKHKEPIFAILMVTLTFLLLITRILYINATQGDLIPKYKDPGISSEFYRGTIYSKGGNILAIDVPTYFIHFSGVPVREPARIAAAISPFTDIDPLFLERILKNNQGNSFSIPSNLESSSRDDFNTLIEDENMENLISLEKTITREYPFQEHGKYIVGRMEKGQGISGAEKEAMKALLPPLDFDKAINKGSEIILPIDMELQYASETVLDKLLGESTDTFSILSVLDRNTLEILALDARMESPDFKILKLLEKILGAKPTFLLSEKEIELPEEIPSSLEENYISHYLGEKYLILSISSDETVSKEGAEILKALLEARNRI